MKKELVLIGCIFALFSCTDYHDDDVPDRLSVDANEVAFSANAGNCSIKVRSGERWDVSNIPDWISVQSISQMSSPFEWDVFFSAATNNDYNREGTITLKTKSETLDIKASQEGKKGKYVSVESISLSREELSLPEGDSYFLTCNVYPSNASDASVIWTSSDNTVATVEKGNIVAIKEGTTIISASVGGVSASCLVTVKIDPSRYLTFEIISDGYITWTSRGSFYRTIEYSKDNGETWLSVTSSGSGTAIPVKSGDVLLLRGDNDLYCSNGVDYNCFGCRGGVSFYAYGPITSLLSKERRDSLLDYALCDLFANCSGLFSHPSKNLLLPSSVLGFECYFEMFRECANMARAPEIHASVLAARCSMRMFEGCKALTVAPSLPALSLASECYFQMFSGCASLSVAPDLPATDLVYRCYGGMFMDCLSLKSAPRLAAFNLAERCYEGMFARCSNLVSAPDLPATVLAECCYQSMFQGCSNLISAPDLPSEEMANGCYAGMFWGCSNLVSAPTLPARNLATSCYSSMFNECKSLTDAPDLPATSLKPYCYKNMFYWCLNLAKAPELPAAVLAEECYCGMFYHCTSINYIKCLATDISANESTGVWLSEVSSVGTFICPNSMASVWPRGDSGIPEGWVINGGIPVTGISLNKTAISMIIGESQTLSATVIPSDATDKTVKWVSSDPSVANVDQNGTVIAISEGEIIITASVGVIKAECRIVVEPALSDYLTFEIVSGGIILWKAIGMTDHKTIEYSRDEGKSWTSITATDNGSPINVSIGDKILFRGNNSSYACGFDSSGQKTYDENGDVILEHKGKITANCFSVSDGTRFYAYGPVTSLLNKNKRDRIDAYAFTDLFHGCAGLMSHPSKDLLLPSDIVGYASYAAMFEGCTNLKKAPMLPASTLADNCYYYMFSRCTNLTQSPTLPATKLTYCCYNAMFSNCTSLEQAGDLYSETIDIWSCSDMFLGCKYLKQAPKLPAISLAPNCYADMFEGCKSLINAPELPATVLSESCYAGMFSGCTSLTSAPELPANTLAEHCYGSMFYSCSSLVLPPSLPATVLQKDCYAWMFTKCTSLTIAPDLPATKLVSGCYDFMFADCVNLYYVKCLATDVSSLNCTNYWLKDVSPIGTFVKNKNMSTWSTGSSGIPSGWSIVDD